MGVAHGSGTWEWHMGVAHGSTVKFYITIGHWDRGVKLIKMTITEMVTFIYFCIYHALKMTSE